MEEDKNKVALVKEKISQFFSSPKRRLIFYFCVFFAISLLLSILALFSNNKSKKLPTTSVKPAISLSPSPYENVTPENYIQAKYVPGQLVVKLKPTTTKEQLSEYLKKYNAKIIDSIEEFRSYSIEVPRGEEEKIYHQVEQDGFVERVEPNIITEVFMAVNDEKFNEQWYLKNPSKADICAQDAWDKSQGDGVKVAVIDTGIDTHHPDLAGKVVASQSFVGGSVEDNMGHGTHVAGIIAANTNNGQGIAGVCPKCQLIIAKSQGDDGKGDSMAMTKAIKWSADQGAKIINMSLGAPQSQSMVEEAVNYAVGKGVIIVAAAGNDNVSQKSYPAGYDNVVSVAATDQKDEKASFSNFGAWVKVAAPGFQIMSTTPTHPFNLQQMKPGTQNNYAKLDGTSMASPVVAGVLGLIYAKEGSNKDAAIKKLYDTAEQINGTGKYWVKGRVSACKALGADCKSSGKINPAFTCISEEGKCITPTIDVAADPNPSNSECKASSKNPADKFPDSPAAPANPPPAKAPAGGGKPGGGGNPCKGGWTDSTSVQCL